MAPDSSGGSSASGATGGTGGFGGTGATGGTGGFGGTGATGGTGGFGGTGATGGTGGSGGASGGFCGDGKKNGFEQCDGSDLGGKTCASHLGAGYAGTLKCSGACYFDTAACTAVCTPNCSGKSCGSDGCGGVCGTCSGDTTCKSGSCEACTSSCPTLKTPSLPKSVQCTPNASDCSTCGPASCGGPRFSVTCAGTPVGSEYPGPDIAGCQWKQTNTFCCPAGCTRHNGYDSYCTQKGLPGVGRACTLGAPMPSGCQKAPGLATSTYTPACCAT